MGLSWQQGPLAGACGSAAAVHGSQTVRMWSYYTNRVVIP
jgi:hypothetical protein